jgi:hypothetical protein
MCRFTKFQTHVPFMRKIEDDYEHCFLTFMQKTEETSAKMEQQDMRLRAVCW